MSRSATGGRQRVKDGLITMQDAALATALVSSALIVLLTLGLLPR
jgi:hypothetical protein